VLDELPGQFILIAGAGHPGGGGHGSVDNVCSEKKSDGTLRHVAPRLRNAPLCLPSLKPLNETKQK
jgi:hypothetical protein